MYKLNSLIILIIFVLLTGVSLASTIDTNVVNLGGATGTLAIVHGGTGATTANGALSSLGIEDSTNQSILVPNGATFQEPSPGVDGMIRYNTTTNQLETYNSSGTWQNIFVTGGSGGALSIGNGGTGATDASGALKNISGVYNASACGYTNKPSWCSGSDIGAWINAAASDIGTSSSRYGKIIIDTANYNFSTSIALPNNIVLDCQASLLNYTSISGAALVVGGANGGNQFNPSSVEHCRIAHTSGYTTGNTNLGVYLGGDPTGSLSSSSNYAPSVLLLDDDVYGFKQGLSYGNNAWVLNINGSNIHDNYDNIYLASGHTNAGEQMSAVKSDIYNASHCGINSQVSDEWSLISGSLDFNTTAVCGTSAIITFINEHFEQSTGPFVNLTGQSELSMTSPRFYLDANSGSEHGLLYMTGTSGFFGGINITDGIVFGNYTPSYLIYTNSASVLPSNIQNFNWQTTGVGTQKFTDASSTTTFAFMGGVSIGSSFVGTSAPSNGLAIQGQLAVGTASTGGYAAKVYQNTASADLDVEIQNAYSGNASYLITQANSNYSALQSIGTSGAWASGMLGTANYEILDQTNTKYPLIIAANSPTNSIYVGTSGVGIGTSTTSQQLTVNGTFSTTGTNTLSALTTAGVVTTTSSGVLSSQATSGISVGTATNIAGGGVNYIPYQTASGTTSFFSPSNSSLFVTNSSGVPSESTAIPSGVTATTQAEGSADNKVATDNYVNGITSLSSLSTVGTIGTGTWQGTAIAPAYGGLGANESSSTGVVQFSSGSSSVSSALANGTTATTQTEGSSDTKVATDNYVNNIATLSSLSSIGTITTGIWNAGAVTSSGSVAGINFNATGTTVPTNGVYLPASNTLGFSVNSGEGMALGTNGLGIGSNTPASRLDISDAGRITVDLTGTKTVTDTGNQVGLEIQQSFSPTVSTVNARDVWLYPNMQPGSGVTITNGVSLYIDSGATGGSGTITNGYGIYVNNPSFGTNKYAAYFGGNVGIGTTTPSKRLDVYGTAGSTMAANGLPVFNKVVVQTFTSSGTYTPTTGMQFATMECWGGGGGGGGVAGSASGFGSGGGGGAGEYSRITSTASTIGSSQTVTIGSAGAASSSGNNAGGNGGASSVGTLVVANGGTGGAGSGGTSPSNGGVGGTGGTGDIVSKGAVGFTGLGGSIITLYSVGAQGGATLVGSSGQQTISSPGSATGGYAAIGYGAGGSGAATCNSTSSVAGGAGAAGLCVITEYISN